MENKGASGSVLAVGFIAIVLILLAIFFTDLPNNWRLFCGFAGFTIILFLTSAATAQGSGWVALVVGILALVCGGFAVNYFLKAVGAQ